MKSPYQAYPSEQWKTITTELIDRLPIKQDKIVEIILKAWDDIFKSKLGDLSIGTDIKPAPQIMGFFLHELVAHYVSQEYTMYKKGELKNEKDLQHSENIELSVEIKCSSHTSQIFGNRSYAQPRTQDTIKSKDGYYITINFEHFKLHPNPQITMIRLGYLEHNDWFAQISSSGQQSRLQKNTYDNKFITLYDKKIVKQ